MERSETLRLGRGIEVLIIRLPREFASCYGVNLAEESGSGLAGEQGGGVGNEAGVAWEFDLLAVTAPFDATRGAGPLSDCLELLSGLMETAARAFGRGSGAGRIFPIWNAADLRGWGGQTKVLIGGLRGRLLLAMG